MAASGLETPNSDYVKNTGTQSSPDSESKLGDLAVSLENLLLEDLKIRPQSFYRVRINTERLNSMFRPLLPSGFDFSKNAQPHLLLDIIIKC
jgi:hypothetical protein